MATVDSWFDDFIPRLVKRLPRTDWPKAGTEFWTTLRERLVKHGLTEADADAASKEMADNPPQFLDKVWPELLSQAKALWASRQPGEPIDDREAARQASLECPDCGGAGMLTVYHPFPDPTRRIPESTVAACVCPSGRWVWRAHCRDFKGKPRFVDLAEVAAGRSPWRLDPPWMAEAQAVRESLVSAGNFFAAARDLAESMRLPAKHSRPPARQPEKPAF